MCQMKKQNKTLEKELNVTDISNVPDNEINDYKDAQWTAEKSGRTQNFNKETENIKKNQSKLKNIITKMKSTLQGINRLVTAEEWQQSDNVMGSSQAEQGGREGRKREKILSEDMLRDLLGHIKNNTICIIGVPAGKRGGEKDRKVILRNNS